MLLSNLVKFHNIGLNPRLWHVIATSDPTYCIVVVLALRSTKSFMMQLFPDLEEPLC